jgi:hypothetical protein
MRKSGINPYLPILANFPQHADALEVKQLVPQDVFDNYYKFAFVRNPWAWQVSLYHYAQQTRKHYQHKITKGFSFEEYLEWRVDNNYRSQKSFITDKDGNLIVDYVGKLENIETDFKNICSTIDIDAKLGHHNKSKHTSYKKYYTKRTSELIETTFAEDIEAFDYHF